MWTPVQGVEDFQQEGQRSEDDKIKGQQCKNVVSRLCSWYYPYLHNASPWGCPACSAAVQVSAAYLLNAPFYTAVLWPHVFTTFPPFPSCGQHDKPMK